MLKTLVAWSGGKDSSLALRALLEDPVREPTGLLTTVTRPYDRISMHGVRLPLLEEQARSVGLPLRVVFLEAGDGETEYAAKTAASLEEAKETGVTAVAFGDLFLEDVRAYRESRIGECGLESTFPLWGRDTRELAREFIEAGYLAWVSCVDGEVLDPRFAGRAYDEAFLHDLPAGIDPCGERGEFHTFVVDGPIFHEPVACEPGEVVTREQRFHFCDLVPA